MPNVLWWGTNAPKLTRQKNIPPWTDDTTYTDGNENGHTWNFGLGTRLETFNQINEFARAFRRAVQDRRGYQTVLGLHQRFLQQRVDHDSVRLHSETGHGDARRD